MERGRSLTRRARYAVASLFCAAALWLVNAEPGWQVWGFLTAQTANVIAMVNIALVVGLLSNAALLLWDTSLLRGLRDALTSTFALIVLAKVFVAFPFDIPEGSGWRIAVRVLLGALMVVSFIGLVAGWGRVARALYVNAHLRR